MNKFLKGLILLVVITNVCALFYTQDKVLSQLYAGITVIGMVLILKMSVNEEPQKEEKVIENKQL